MCIYLEQTYFIEHKHKMNCKIFIDLSCKKSWGCKSMFLLINGEEGL